MRTPKAADRANGWPKLLRDVQGMRVRLKQEAQNGWVRIPAGTTGTLGVQSNGWHLLHFEADPCPHCKVSPSISRMSWTYFEPLAAT